MCYCVGGEVEVKEEDVEHVVGVAVVWLGWPGAVASSRQLPGLSEREGERG